jgi:16S rRNA (guanine1207-N2)-methyltransferase
VSGDHYFAARPAAPSRPRRVHLELPDLDHPLGLTTDAGVFSATEVDPGTRLLLTEGARPDPAARVLADVGCGYGPIAVALALRAPAAEVWAVDVNERAVELCRANAETAGVGDRVRAVTPDEVPDGLVLDGLWSNPPVRVGKAALHGLLELWLPRLAPGAPAHLVVARNLGADSLATWLTDRGHQVARRASRRGYRLLDVTP